MIQNINFPEGTKVSYVTGSVFDQFNKDVEIDIELGSLYKGSNLYSARKLNGSYNNAFNNSNVYFRPHILAYGMYDNATAAYDVILDKSQAYDGTYCFRAAAFKSFITISANLSSASDFMISSDAEFITWDVDTSNLSSIIRILPNTYIYAVFGNISVKSIGNMNNSYLVGYGDAKSLRHITISDIGTNQSQTSVDFSRLIIWGVNHTSLPNSRQSLIDSLITYSFDRAAAGYSNCTIKLSAKTKALLTAEEIAQITAKGYTIS